jgi:hypothetical protein
VARADAVLPAGTVPVGGEQRAALEQLQLRLVRWDGGGRIAVCMWRCTHW